MTGNSVNAGENEKGEMVVRVEEENGLSGKSRKSWLGIRCCHDEYGLACDERLLFWVTPSGDIPA